MIEGASSQSHALRAREALLDTLAATHIGWQAEALSIRQRQELVVI